jgi:hypothetical protein
VRPAPASSHARAPRPGRSQRLILQSFPISIIKNKIEQNFYVQNYFLFNVHNLGRITCILLALTASMHEQTREKIAPGYEL